MGSNRLAFKGHVFKKRYAIAAYRVPSNATTERSRYWTGIHSRFREALLEFFASTFYGFFFGFALVVGCSLVVLYAIYSGGYRKALEDSLRTPPPERYMSGLSAAKKKIANEASDSGSRP